MGGSGDTSQTTWKSLKECVVRPRGEASKVQLHVERLASSLVSSLVVDIFPFLCR